MERLVRDRVIKAGKFRLEVLFRSYDFSTMHCFPVFRGYKINKEKIINVPNCLGISGDTHTHTHSHTHTHKHTHSHTYTYIHTLTRITGLTFLYLSLYI